MNVAYSNSDVDRNFHWGARDIFTVSKLRTPTPGKTNWSCYNSGFFFFLNLISFVCVLTITVIQSKGSGYERDVRPNIFQFCEKIVFLVDLSTFLARIRIISTQVFTRDYSCFDVFILSILAETDITGRTKQFAETTSTV